MSDRITLLDQWLLALAAARDPRPPLAGLDLRILIIVIERFRKDYGNGRVASRYLADVLGVDRRNIRDSLRKLLKLGYLEQISKPRGGRRPTEYRPRFELASGGTSTPPTGVSGGTGTPESYLPGLRTGKVGTRGCSAAPNAPVGAGGALGAAPRDPGFEELWDAYAFKQERRKAKAAYQKLNPDAALHVQMLAAARAWAANYAKNNTEEQWRMMLHNWIGDENWLANPPRPYRDPKAVKAPAAAKAPSPVAAKKPGKARPAAVKARAAPSVQLQAAAANAARMSREQEDELRKAKAAARAEATAVALKWLDQRIADDKLGVPDIAKLLGIFESTVESVVSGRCHPESFAQSDYKAAARRAHSDWIQRQEQARQVAA
jgi:hypothetical protein